MSPEFLSMRAGLVERGLLNADFAMTEAGTAYVEGLIVGLRMVEAENNPGGCRVTWNTKGRGLPPREPSAAARKRRNGGANAQG